VLKFSIFSLSLSELFVNSFSISLLLFLFGNASTKTEWLMTARMMMMMIIVVCGFEILNLKQIFFDSKRPHLNPIKRIYINKQEEENQSDTFRDAKFINFSMGF
jgi:hypothetical protein